MGGNSEPRDLPKTAWHFSFQDSPKMLYVKQKLPKADRGSCQDPELKAPVWVAQGWACTQAAKASEGTSSTLVHAPKFPYGMHLPSRMLTFCTQALPTTFCISKGINVHLHQKPHQTTQNCIINALVLWGIWISSTCKWNWSAQAVQLRQEEVNFTLLLSSSVFQPARNVLEQWKTQRNPS